MISAREYSDGGVTTYTAPNSRAMSATTATMTASCPATPRRARTVIISCTNTTYATMRPPPSSSAGCAPIDRATTESESVTPIHFSAIAPNPMSSTKMRRNFPCHWRTSAFDSSPLAGTACGTGVGLTVGIPLAERTPIPLPSQPRRSRGGAAVAARPSPSSAVRRLPSAVLERRLEIAVEAPLPGRIEPSREVEQHEPVELRPPHADAREGTAGHPPPGARSRPADMREADDPRGGVVGSELGAGQPERVAGRRECRLPADGLQAAEIEHPLHRERAARVAGAHGQRAGENAAQ